MKWVRLTIFALIVTGMCVVANAQPTQSPDPLPSWNESSAKRALVTFVEAVTSPTSEQAVPVSQRIAVLDNDGTLWPEAPMPFQVAFALDELKRRAPQEPALASDPMVQAALAGDVKRLLEGKHHDGLMRVLSHTHTGMTTDEFDARVKNWIATATHPRFQRRYTDLAYQPMQELLRYLRANGFSTYIVSGGGADFMRVWSEDVYGIGPENVVGTTSQTKFELRDGVPTLVKTPDHLFVDDRDGKPVGIHQFIGRRPIACFGNSDGDQAMLQYTTIANPHPSFGMIIHHTDAEREYAYDANPSSSGKLTTALAMAPERNWTVVDMKRDWLRVFSHDGDQTPEATFPSIVGKWIVEDIARRGVVDRAQATLEVTSEHRVTGNSTVNGFGGEATLEGSKIQFKSLAMTRRAGPPALMEQESRYMDSLGKTTQFEIDANGMLLLKDPAGNELVRLSRMAQ